MTSPTIRTAVPPDPHADADDLYDVDESMVRHDEQPHRRQGC